MIIQNITNWAMSLISPGGLGVSANPMEQFRIHTIFPMSIMGFDISFTNSTLFMMVAIFGATGLLLLATHKCSTIPTKSQMVAEIIYNFISGTLSGNAGSEGMKYFPLVFTVFLYVLSCNLAGLLPFGFTATAHIAVTATLASIMIALITIIGLMKNGWKFFRVFLPPNIPLVMAPIMITIEVFTYFSRIISLSIRLAANMVAGHTMLKVVSAFVGSLSLLLATVPFNFLIILNMFELFVAILQAYIFAILSCVYLDSVLHIH